MEIMLSRISSIENQLESIQSSMAEQQKWKIIVQHFILKMFEFDIEKELQKNNFLSFFYEQPNVVNMVAKNLQFAPQIESILKKQQLELAQYLKSGMCCIDSPQNKTVLQQQQQLHKTSSRSSNSSTSLHHHQQQQIPLPRPVLQNSNSCCPPPIQNTIHLNPNPYSMNNQLPNRPYLPPTLQPPPSSRSVNIPPNHYPHQNPPLPPSVLQNELAWLKQISNRPTESHPQPQQQQQQYQQPPPHHNSNSTSNLHQSKQQKPASNAPQNRSSSASSRTSWVDLPDTARPLRLQRFPVTIERVPVAELMEPVPKSRRLGTEPRISALNTQSNPSYTQNFARGSVNQESPYAKFQEMIDDLTIGRLGAVAQQQTTTINPVIPSKQTCRKSTSRPMAAPSLDYTCGQCGMKFREKRAAELHFAKIHAPRLPLDFQMQSNNSGLDQRNVPLLITNKRHESKDGSTSFSSSVNINPSSNNNNNETTIGNTSTTITPINNRVILDEITISDDDEEGDGNNKNLDNRNIKNNGSTTTTTSEISGIIERVYNDIVQESPENSTSSSSSSYVIGSSKLSLIVGEKSISSPKSISSSTSLHQYQSPGEQNIDSPGRRSRSDSNSNSNFSTSQQQQLTIDDTITSENMEIVPEINFYTDENDVGVGEEEESIGIDTERDELEMRWINENNIVHTEEENSQTTSGELHQEEEENHGENVNLEQVEESPDTIIS